VSAPVRSTAVVAAIVAATALLVGVGVWLAVAVDRTGSDVPSGLGVDSVGDLAAIVSATAVGAALAVRRPRHPVGWLFLALGAAVALTRALTGYALYGEVARPGSLPVSQAVAALADSSWVLSFGLVMWILHLTPTGAPLGDRWRWCAVGATVAMALWVAVMAVSPGHLGPPLESVRSPWAADEDAFPLHHVVRGALGLVSGVGLLVGAVSLLVRFRRSRGDERRRLLWLAVAVVPLPAFVALAYWAADDHPVVLAVAVAGFTALVPVAAGLSIARYHLYDVDRILSRAVAWLLVSGVLALTFALIVVTVGRFVGSGDDASLPAVLGTLGAVAVAAPAYRAFQEAVDRRFDRRRFDAIRRTEEHVRDPDPATTVESVLREALHDPSLRVAYWIEDRGEWLSPDGRRPDDDAARVDVRRHERPVARVTYDGSVADAPLVEAVCRAATPELENAMLRARISVQLEEVRASRARIAAAHVSERRRLERNLHDGAQQHLLAVAMDLRAAQLNGSPERLSATVAAAVDDLQSAVLELRQLAAGLHPASLQRSGLAGAVEELATRFPVAVELDGLDGRRFPEEVEAAAWFIACEGIANAVKHASAEQIAVAVRAGDGRLTVQVRDDGRGGADPAGRGLRGLADRTEAAGGSLVVRSGAAGTTLTGELPCGS
jgi:signal transduction histidine kinase